MKRLLVRLEDDIFLETEKVLAKVKKTRTKYFNEAIAFYNLLHTRQLLSKQVLRESRIVSTDSMKVLAEFERLNDEF